VLLLDRLLAEIELPRLAVMIGKGFGPNPLLGPLNLSGKLVKPISAFSRGPPSAPQLFGS
jgi:hypothetical protein